MTLSSCQGLGEEVREEVMFAVAARKQPQGARRGGFREKVTKSRVRGKHTWPLASVQKKRKGGRLYCADPERDCNGEGASGKEKYLLSLGGIYPYHLLFGCLKCQLSPQARDRTTFTFLYGNLNS